MLQLIGDVELESDQACAVYDPNTGRIEHVHHVITLKGGTKPERSVIEAKAIEFATQKGEKTSQLKTLFVSPEKLRPGTVLKVDLKRGSIISKELKQQRK